MSADADLTIKTHDLRSAFALGNRLAEGGEQANRLLFSLDGRILTLDQAKRLFAAWDQRHPDGTNGRSVTYYGFRLLCMDDFLMEVEKPSGPHFIVNASAMHTQMGSDDDDSDDDSDEDNYYA